jgi:dienelactone hydrolase
MKEVKMKKCLCVTLSVFLVFVSLGFAADKSNFTFAVVFGPHPVGFRVVHQYDYSRVYRRAFDLEGKPVTGERARPIQTLVWYPAQPDKSAQPMLYGRYIEVTLTEEDFDMDSAQKAALLKTISEGAGGIPKDKYEIERVKPTHAFWEAKPISGKFPSVIYAPSFSSSAFENSDLCEYLASNGFIVIASPDMGSRSRAMTDDIVGVQTQAADIEFLIGYLHNIPQADTSHIAVAGFSWGGISNVFAQVQDDRITALVCIDGSIYFQQDFAKDARYVTAGRVTVPLLYLANRGFDPSAAWRPYVASGFLDDAKYSDFHFVRFSGMQHHDFSSLFIRLLPDEHFTDNTAAEISEGYSWMARYVLHFLSAYLKNDELGHEFLKNSPEKNGTARHQLTVQFRPALHPVPVVADFARELAKQGFDKAIPFWQEVKKKDPGFMLPEKEVNAFGYQLMGSGKLNEAIAIFKLNVAMYPEGYNTYDSLAEAQAAAGDKQSAIANYKKSLELNSGNTNAVERLKKLESNPIK